MNPQVDSQTAAPSLSILDRILLVAIIVLALGVRLAHHPQRYEIRDTDEIPYATCGLQFFEGIPGGMRTTPNGPQSWLSWGYAVGGWAKHFLRPDAAAASLPTPLRFYEAADVALFQAYADCSSLREFLLGWQLAFALVGTFAAYRTGLHYGGLSCALILGGLMACLPTFVDFSGMTRPYSDAWSAIFVAFFFLSTRQGNSRCWGGGLAYGFAIGSRIDMLALAPLMILLVFLKSSTVKPIRTVFKLTAISAITAYCLAPWSLIHFFGVIRSIALIRVSGQFRSDNPRLQTATELFWLEGLGPLFAFLLIAGGIRLARPKGRTIIIAGYVSLLITSMFTGPYQPIRYHGTVILATLMILAITWRTIFQPQGKFQYFVCGAILVLPIYQTVRLIERTRFAYTPDGAVSWIENNVPAGSKVFLTSALEVRALLPTRECADRLWTAATDQRAWRRKLQRGFDRFQLKSDDFPRAFSEENLWLDRGNRRRWFLLGGNHSDRPRYDIEILGDSAVFDVQNLPEALARTGGFLIWHGDSPAENLGTIRASWVNAEGYGTYVLEAIKRP